MAGLTVAHVETRATEIDNLHRLGYLKDQRVTGHALSAAVGDLLDRLPPPERWQRAE